MSEVKLCRDCRHCMPEPGSEWTLRCMHPEVNSRDPWALASPEPHGSCARDERKKAYLGRCGMKGRLWEPKVPGSEWVPLSERRPKLGQRCLLSLGGAVQYCSYVFDDGDDGPFWELPENDYSDRHVIPVGEDQYWRPWPGAT